MYSLEISVALPDLNLGVATAAFNLKRNVLLWYAIWIICVIMAAKIFWNFVYKDKILSLSLEVLHFSTFFSNVYSLSNWDSSTVLS